MTSAVRKLTRLSGGHKQLAALLQSKGRGNDTILAHITPREADLLKRRGGSGTRNPETGLLEFDDGGGFSFDDYAPASYDLGQANFGQQTSEPVFSGNTAAPAPSFDTTQPEPTGQSFGDYSFDLGSFSGAPQGQGLQPGAEQYGTITPGTSYGTIGAPTGGGVGAFPTVGAPGGGPTSSQIPDFLKKLGSGVERAVTDPGNLTKLALAGLSAYPGIKTANRAQQQGQQVAQQQRNIGAPYQAQGQALQAQAASGQLTPAGQQQLEIARAQLQQQATARGGVGVEQQAAIIERLRQQLLQSQADYGVKLSSIGDQIALGAIKTGLEQDQYVNNLRNQYFTNIARMLGGYAPEATPGG